MPSPISIKKTTDEQVLRQHVIELVTAAPAKVTPFEIGRRLRKTYNLRPEAIKSLIKTLVSQGELAYAYECGRTFLEPSFNRPVRISRFVVLQPPERCYQALAGEIVVRIKPGAAFGRGQHPTTRLAIRCIEHVCRDIKQTSSNFLSSILDIGTGTGVLVLAAIRLGVQHGVGIDIDPIARAEALENVQLNCLEDRIEIREYPLESIRRQYWLVTANLRSPSLLRGCDRMANLTAPGGFLVFSGVRIEERQALLEVYAWRTCNCLWQTQEMDWTAVLLQRRV